MEFRDVFISCLKAKVSADIQKYYDNCDSQIGVEEREKRFEDLRTIRRAEKMIHELVNETDKKLAEGKKTLFQAGVIQYGRPR